MDWWRVVGSAVWRDIHRLPHASRTEVHGSGPAKANQASPPSLWSCWIPPMIIQGWQNTTLVRAKSFYGSSRCSNCLHDVECIAYLKKDWFIPTPILFVLREDCSTQYLIKKIAVKGSILAVKQFSCRHLSSSIYPCLLNIHGSQHRECYTYMGRAVQTAMQIGG